MTRKRKKKSFFKDWIKAIIIALILLWLSSVFIIQIYPVSGSFMSSTLVPGDFIVVNKLKYGPRFPVTPLSLPLIGDKMPFSGKNNYLDWIQLPGYRLPGFSEPKHNDIVFFNYPQESEKPIDRRTRYAKRCIGLPGDTIKIDKKKVFVNQKPAPLSEHMQFAYRVIAKPKSINRELLRNLNISEGNLVSDAGVYRLYLTDKQADTISKLPFVNQIRIETSERGFGEPLVFPQHPSIAWNLDNFGPVIVPGKNISIKLNHKNIAIYKQLIVLEKNNVETEGNKIVINGAETSEYTFKSNYYFVIDDNRDNSKDSRYWGFLPENHIIGKTNLIAFSLNKRNEGLSLIRWKRFFKKIN